MNYFTDGWRLMIYWYCTCKCPNDDGNHPSYACANSKYRPSALGGPLTRAWRGQIIQKLGLLIYLLL